MTKSGVLKKIWKSLSTGLVVLVVLIAVLLVGVRLIGVEVYTVTSGSMKPEYPVGSLIYVKKTDPSKIRAGDVITYVLKSGTVSTHRVVSVDEETQQFQTKGDANDAPDGEPVHFNNLIGTPIFKLPYLGYLAYYIQHPPGTYVTIAVMAVLLLIVFIPELFKNKKQED